VFSFSFFPFPLTFGFVTRLVVLVAALLLFFVAPSLIGFYTDWLWFGEVGYQQIFSTMFRTQGTVFTAVFAITAAWLAFNFTAALAAVGDARPVFTTREGVEVVLPGRRQLRGIAQGIALIVAIFMGIFASSRWMTWLSWRYGVEFGERDPILGYDISFYVFTLPFLELVRGLAQSLIVLAALGAGVTYFVSGTLGSTFGRTIRLPPAARRHLSLLAAAFFLTLAFSAWLGRAALLTQASGLIHGASYADVHGRMPAALVLIAAGVIGAGLAVLQATSSRNWPIGAAVALYVAAAVAGEGYSSLLQRFVVTPNEQARESPFIQHNIEATRRAFALDGVQERRLSGDAQLTNADIAANAPTIENVRLWDHQPLLQTFGQLQELRPYYDFASVDNDRYHINGRSRQVMLSARELNSTSLQNRTWVNERLTFTHGYGLTLGPVNQVTEQGLPVLFIENIPPETSVPDLTVAEPSIYFGELSNDYVIVRTRTAEFHYPKGNENVFESYKGNGGLPLDSLWRKLIFAFRFGAYQMVLNDDITAESRVMFNRNIRTRVRTLAPFLTFDGDPYMVVVDGRLYWIYDAYTISDRYPYSTSANNINYIRNAVKVVIDAYHGTTTLYLADAKDPIATTYARMFPGTFKPLSEMPAGIRAHVRYPEDIFAVQASIFATYHMTQPAVFYNREDQWEIPTIEAGREAQAMQPYYTIMRLPGEKEAEFIQMLPFTPRRKDNLAAWLVARSDGDHYGHLSVFEFPKQKVVFGPRQVVARISQDEVIAPQITLWNQQGSEVIWGTLMVIPIEESLIYVRPLYLRGSGSNIPALTRVVVAHQDQVVMDNTLEAGLERLFAGVHQRQPPATGAAPPTTPTPAQTQPTTPATDSSLSALAAEAEAHYQKALAAQRAGDWATYGEEIKRVGEILARMKGLRP
jgi:uncharacterized membrane protein (UPF0182 family)